MPHVLSIAYTENGNVFRVQNVVMSVHEGFLAGKKALMAKWLVQVS